MQDFLSIEYDLTVDTIRSHDVGYNNLAKIIKSPQGIFFYKQYRRINVEKIQRILHVISFLADNSFLVPIPQKTIRGDLISIHDNEPGVLFSFLKGVVKTEFSQEELQCVGETLANIHVCLAKYPHLDRFIHQDKDYNATDWYDHNLEHLSDDSSEDVKQIAEAYDSLKSESKELDLNSLPRSLLHWDFRNENVLFDNGAISGVTDFECLHYDCRVYDLVFATIGFCLLNGWNKRSMRHILEGYESVSTLSSNEKKAFPYLQKLMIWDKWCSIYISAKSPEFNTRRSRTKYTHYRECYQLVKDDTIL